MDEMNELHKGIDFEKLIYHYKDANPDVSFNDFITVGTLFYNFKSHKIELEDVEKIKWNLNQK